MLPLLLTASLLAFPAAPQEPPAPPAWPSTVSQNGRTWDKDEESLPYALQCHRKIWAKPGVSGHSDAVPREHQVKHIPTISGLRWANAPCFLAYRYRFTDEELPLLNIAELCNEMDMARCWDDTHYLRRLTANLTTRFITPEEADRRKHDPVLTARLDNAQMLIATTNEVEAWAAGKVRTGMTLIDVCLTTRTGPCTTLDRSESPLGIQTVYRYPAVEVRAGRPEPGALDEHMDEWNMMPFFASHTMTVRTCATVTTLQRHDVPLAVVTWWHMDGKGLDDRAEGQRQWRTSLLAEANVFTPEPPPAKTPAPPTPAPDPDPTATLPGDFSKPLPATSPTPPNTRPPDPNKPAQSLPPTPQPPPDR